MAAPAEADDLKRALRRSSRLWLGLFLLFFLLGSGMPQSLDETQMIRVAKGLSHFHWADLLPTKYAIGTSLFEVPFVWLGQLAARLMPGEQVQAMWLCTYLMPPAFGALSAVLVWTLARALGQSPRHAAVSVFCFAFASFALAYQTRLFSEGAQTTALLAAVVLVWKYRQTPSTRLLYGIGLALGALFTLKPASAAISGPFFAWFLWKAVPGGSIVARLGRAGHVVAGAIPGIAVVLMHNRLRYGSVWSFGYSEERDLEYGFHGSLAMGIYGLLLSPGAGLIVYMPVGVAGIAGLVTLRRRHPASAILTLGLPLAFVLFHARWWSWHGGWCWGPRFLVPVTPLLALGVGELDWESWSRTGRNALRALIAVSTLMQIPGLAVSSQDYAEHVMVACQKSFPSWQEQSPTTPSGPVDDNLEIHFLPAFSPPLGHSWLALSRLFGDVGQAPWDGQRLCERLRPKHKPLEFWWATAMRTQSGLALAMTLFAAALLVILAAVVLSRWWGEIDAMDGRAERGAMTGEPPPRVATAS